LYWYWDVTIKRRKNSLSYWKFKKDIAKPQKYIEMNIPMKRVSVKDLC
jgi:hypothetical protein